MPEQPHSEPPASPSAGATPAPAPRLTWGRRLMRWGKRLLFALILLLLLSGGLLAVAEHKTSQPQFCGSCHIMEPYYESWEADIHGGKLNVACVECHYAPGERTTIKAKLRGLSQVASYFSGRYGSTRPRAHVDNRSCLTSNCHGDMRFMDKELSLGTVKFTHAKHMKLQDEKEQATQKELEQLNETLQALLGKDKLDRIADVAREATPQKQRMNQMTEMVRGWQTSVKPEQLEKLTHLYHRQLRLAQLKDMQCTNCHSYGTPDLLGKDASRRGHFSMKTTSCYTCHFHNEGFNTGTSQCLLCHTLPTKELMIHPKTPPDLGEKLKTPELTKQQIKMDHRQIIERKVDCVACHADVAVDTARVSRRDCERCHDRPEYFKQWKEPFSLAQVEHYHAAHVPEQRAKCLDCHSEIHHQLARGNTPTGQPQFLTSAMSNCTSCHPNHHLEQIELLSGKGSQGVPHGQPNMMFGSRTNCFGCHTEKSLTPHGGETLQGTLNGCIACHGERYTKTFEQWKQGLKIYTMDADEAYDKARKMFDQAKDLTPDARQKASDLLTGARADLQLVKRGNGVHNVMYSMEILESIAKRCQQAMAVIRAGGARKP